MSIVTFNPDHAVLTATLDSLMLALATMSEEGGFTANVCVVDNSELCELNWVRGRYGAGVHVRHGHGNIGFGRGHNLCLDSGADFHLVLNPDVELAPDSLALALGFMSDHPECGLLSPSATWADGTAQPLCKRYPTLLDLVLRGFAPAWLKHLFRRRLARYEMRDVMSRDVLWHPPIVSGCFMLFRSDVLQKVGGFDERFFLYFEDFDLSLRVAQHGALASVSDVKLVHHGGHASRKGRSHVLMFGLSGYKFFNKHGWRLW